MKQLFLLLTFFSLTIIVSGQTWAPTGAKWTFGVGLNLGSSIGFREWISTGDTVVGGNTCKIIKRNGTLISGDISDELITYEDNNKIYWFTNNQFTVLYDFNKNAGDTWTIMTDICPVLITVDSTKMESINGFALKALYISSDNGSFNGKILQHIGHLSSPNPNIISPCTGIADDSNFYLGLRCYEDSVFGFHDFGIAPSCDYTIDYTIVVDELKKSLEVLLFPNPATHQLNIKTNFNAKFHFNIYNTLGQMMKEGILQSDLSTIYLDDLIDGIYSIELFADNKIARKRFIVQK